MPENSLPRVTDEELAHLTTLHAKATGLPWRHASDWFRYALCSDAGFRVVETENQRNKGQNAVGLRGPQMYGFAREEDAKYAACAANLAPRLAAEVFALRRLLDGREEPEIYPEGFEPDAA